MLSHNLALYIFTLMLFFLFLIASIGFLTMMFNNGAVLTYNSSKPVLTVEGRIISKRFKTFQDTQNFGDMIPSYNYLAMYYVTFELEDKEQLEFCVSANEYEEFNEGDTGKLSYQGNKYLGFERSKEMEQN
ncbi:DUF2500 domain-containing protein [Clostridium sp. UBA4548]|uniref:DUF2500 domain-containing protein n=1 Tax=Clostridium sp. UBA4548 TaxID=1946361 RepID=UPI0025C14837|nr:DUF2500 domain-containing protein [Clostridium sp. UBA4548]